MAEEVEVVRSTEEEKDLQNQLEIGLALETMVSTDGWNRYFAVNMQNLRAGYMNDLVNKSDTHMEFKQAQMAVCVINQLFNFVETGIKLGEFASQRLNEQRSSENSGETG